MIRVDVGAASPEDCARVALDMREADKVEAMAMALAGPFEAVSWSIGASLESFAGRVDGRAVCLFGVGVASLAPLVGRPWLLATDELDAFALPFLRRNRRVIENWAVRFPVLENWVDARHTVAVRWLRWLGFTLDDPAPFGPMGRDFHRFTLQAGRDDGTCAGVAAL